MKHVRRAVCARLCPSRSSLSLFRTQYHVPPDLSFSFSFSFFFSLTLSDCFSLSLSLSVSFSMTLSLSSSRVHHSGADRTKLSLLRPFAHPVAHIYICRVQLRISTTTVGRCLSLLLSFTHKWSCWSIGITAKASPLHL